MLKAKVFQDHSIKTLQMKNSSEQILHKFQKQSNRKAFPSRKCNNENMKIMGPQMCSVKQSKTHQGLTKECFIRPGQNQET